MKEEEARKFQKLWGRLGRRTSTPGDSLEDLLRTFADTLGLVTESASGNESIALVDVRLNTPMPLYPQGRGIIIAINDQHTERVHELYSQLANEAYGKDLSHCPAAILNIRTSASLQARCLSSPIPFVFLDLRLVEAILHAPSPWSHFVSALQEHSDSDIGNPFQFVGPIRDHRMFFGRSSEVKQIIRSKTKNVAIIGSRKSGKTSILFRISEHYSLMGDSAPETVLPIDLSTYSTSEQVMFEIVTRLQPQFQVRWHPDKFSHFLHKIGRGNKHHLILMDECDSVITYDMRNGERMCRALNGSPHFRFVLAGHMGLQRNARSWSSALWNSVEKIHLSSLDLAPAQNLIHDPFVRLGVKVPTAKSWREWAQTEDNPHYRLCDNWIDFVLTQTGRRPALIQLYGSELYRLIKFHGRMEIFPSDLRRVETARFREELIDSFLIDATPITRMVGILLLDCDDRGVTETQLYNASRQLVPSLSLRALQDGLYDLEHVGVLEMEGDRYRFAFPAFPKLLTEYHNVPFLLEETVKAVNLSKNS